MAEPAVARHHLAMLAATVLWGVSGGVIAGIGASGLVAAAVVEFVAAACLLTLAWRQGSIRLTVHMVGVGSLLLLGLVEAANVAFYYVALVTGPPGPVIAVHLTAPVLLVGYGLVRGRERLSARRLVSLPVLVAALVALVSAQPPGESIGRSDTVMALLFSLASAACIGVFVTLASRLAAGGGSAAARGGLQMLISSGMVAASMSVAVWLGDQSATAADVQQLALVGLLLFTPAVWFYWLAMRTLRPTTATVIQLGEPLFGAAAAFALFDIGLSAVHAVAAALVLGSVLLEVGHRRRQGSPRRRPRRPAGLGTCASARRRGPLR
jgi:drug/metabolite transporter (DMT)-like permease